LGRSHPPLPINRHSSSSSPPSVQRVRPVPRASAPPSSLTSTLPPRRASFASLEVTRLSVAWAKLRVVARQWRARVSSWLEKRRAELGHRDTWALGWARARFRWALALSWLAQGKRRYWVP